MSEAKRRTIRLPNRLDEQLEIIAKKYHISVNKLIYDILIQEANNSNSVLNKQKETQEEILREIQQNLIQILKKENWNSKLLLQLFLNSCFAKNRTEKEDFAFQDFLKKNENKFNA